MLNHIARLLWLITPQDRAYAGDKFGKAERFGDVVIGAELESADLVGFLSSRRKHDHRSRNAALPDLPADLESVFSWKHQIEHD